MQQNKRGGYFWAKVARGSIEQQMQPSNARWEPVYRESVLHSPVLLSGSPNWCIWEYGPRLTPPPEDSPKGAFDDG